MSNGGRRPGAGRKKGKANKKTLAARTNATALLESIGEVATWNWVIATAKKKRDAKTVADVMKYLTDRRDGKPRQQIETTGPNGGAMTFQIISEIPRPKRDGHST